MAPSTQKSGTCYLAVQN